MDHLKTDNVRMLSVVFSLLLMLLLCSIARYLVMLMEISIIYLEEQINFRIYVVVI